MKAESAHCSKLVFLNPGLQTCLANNLKRPWESNNYALTELQNSMHATLQPCIAGDYTWEDAWSYKVHRRNFKVFGR